MNMTKLSVSSVILAAVLSGCSQQQVIGGSQVVNGSGGSQISGSQQQVEGAAPIITAAPVVKPKSVVKSAPSRVYNKSQIRSAAAKQKMIRSNQRGNGLPAAKSGQCSAKVKVAPKYATKSKRVLVQKASSQRVFVRAPQYRWIAKKVLVRKAQYTNRTIPAQYHNQTTRILVRPPYHTWKKGHGAITRIDNATGQIMHRVTVPAAYKNVTKRVIVRPVQNVRRFIPAVYKTVKQKKRVSGVLYKTVNRPARYQTKNYRVQVAGARYVWRPVVCATNAPKHYKHKKAAMMQRSVKRVHKQHYKRPAASNGGISYAQYLAVMNAPLKSKASKKKASKKRAAKKAEIQQNIVYGIQAALKSKGYNPGKLDGKMGPNTAKALKAFQSSRGLPVGVLSKDTFRALGLVK